MAQETEWLRSLLGINTLKELCPTHEKHKKTWFCIDCRINICKICSETDARHKEHQRIQLLRNNNYDVFRLEEIQKYFDCSKIQTYKVRDKETVRLKFRPDPGRESQTSTREEIHVTCQVCGENRIYTEEPYTNNRFCSIQCKLAAPDDEDTTEDVQSDGVESPPQEFVEEEEHSS